MRKFLRWAILAAFSAGLRIGIAQRWRTVLGIIGLLISFFGVLYNLCGASPNTPDADPVDIHEVVVMETFARLTPLEAATLVGVLNEYRIVPARNESGWVEALELSSAISLVARVSGLPGEHLRRLYGESWVELRRTTAPGLLIRLTDHRLVERLFPVSELE